MVPIIVAAAVITASIRASGGDALLTQVFEGRTIGMILGASLLGAVTPICGVGVLPIIAGLLGAGAPLAPITAFWLASPITDPAMLAITAGTLGLTFAMAKTVIAFAIGLGGGLATQALLRAGAFRRPLRSRPAVGRACETATASAGPVWRSGAGGSDASFSSMKRALRGC